VVAHWVLGSNRKVGLRIVIPSMFIDNLHLKEQDTRAHLLKMALVCLAFVYLCITAHVTFAQQPPLVDGDCEEYPRLKGKHITISNDVELYLYQDKHYVWFCYSYPDGSFGTLDMKLKTKSLPEFLNLHVSAQIGEWPAGRPERAPQNPESELWWNARGWTANPVWINGMDKSTEKPRYRFKNAKARELQLSKKRFGHGDWLFSMAIRSVKGHNGGLYDVTFPKPGEFYTLKTF